MAKNKGNQPADADPTPGPAAGDLKPTPTPPGPDVGPTPATSVPAESPLDAGRYDPQRATGSAEPLNPAASAGAADHDDAREIPPARVQGQARPGRDRQTMTAADVGRLDPGFSPRRSDTPRQVGQLTRTSPHHLFGAAEPGTAGDAPLTVADVAADIRAFVAAMRGGNVIQAVYLASRIIAALAGAMQEQFVPVGAAGPGEHDQHAVNREDFDKACQEFETCKSDVIANVPALIAGNRRFSGTGPQVSGMAEPLNRTPAGVNFQPGDLMTIFQLVSQAIELYRRIFQQAAPQQPAEPFAG
jgi:hypothetical protein